MISGQLGVEEEAVAFIGADRRHLGRVGVRHPASRKRSLLAKRDRFGAGRGTGRGRVVTPRSAKPVVARAAPRSAGLRGPAAGGQGETGHEGTEGSTHPHPARVSGRSPRIKAHRDRSHTGTPRSRLGRHGAGCGATMRRSPGRWAYAEMSPPWPPAPARRGTGSGVEGVSGIRPAGRRDVGNWGAHRRGRLPRGRVEGLPLEMETKEGSRR